jgi:hypothetical protein
MPECTYVVAALDLAIGLLSTEPVRRTMTTMVELFDTYLPTQERIFQQTSTENIFARVTQFVRILGDSGGPVMVIDPYLPRRTEAQHRRAPWDGPFNVKLHSVQINQNVSHHFV